MTYIFLMIILILELAHCSLKIKKGLVFLPLSLSNIYGVRSDLDSVLTLFIKCVQHFYSNKDLLFSLKPRDEV